MKYINFAGAGILAGLANMLELDGADIEDYQIARGMEAPYLFVYDQGVYRAGSGLYRPEWINPYLKTQGYLMAEHVIAKAELPAFLRAQKSALLSITIQKNDTHPFVFCRYENQRYHFINIKCRDFNEPDTVSLSADMLKRRIADQITVFTLSRTLPEVTNMLPYLIKSLDVLKSYLPELLAISDRDVTREQFEALKTPYLRALCQDAYPMALLIGDTLLSKELRYLYHDYTHTIVLYDPPVVSLADRMSKVSIRKCVSWLCEDILDRMYMLGASDTLLDEKSHLPRLRYRIPRYGM